MKDEWFWVLLVAAIFGAAYFESEIRCSLGNKAECAKMETAATPAGK